MGQRSNDAVLKDAQIRLRKEECVSNTEERGYAAGLGVRTLFSDEECASDTGQRRSNAVQKDAQIVL